MNNDIAGVIIRHIGLATYPTVCLVCREWRRIAVQLHDRGAKLSPLLVMLDKFGANCNRSVMMSATTLPRVPIWFILEHPAAYWYTPAVSSRSDLTPEIYTANPTFMWEMSIIVKNPTLPVEFVLSLDPHGDFSDRISQREDITRDIILKYPNYKWSLPTLARVCGPNFVLEHPGMKWDWSEMHHIFPLEFIVSNPQYEWDYSAIVRSLIYGH